MIRAALRMEDASSLPKEAILENSSASGHTSNWKMHEYLYMPRQPLPFTGDFHVKEGGRSIGPSGVTTSSKYYFIHFSALHTTSALHINSALSSTFALPTTFALHTNSALYTNSAIHLNGKLHNLTLIRNGRSGRCAGTHGQRRDSARPQSENEGRLGDIETFVHPFRK
jgi:hypothetical protein